MSNPFAANQSAPDSDSTPADTQPAPAYDPAANQFASPSGKPAGNPSDLFGAARSGDMHRFSDDEGSFVVVRVLEYVASMSTANGESEAIRADWVPVDGPNAGTVRDNGLIFGRALVPAMRANFEKGIPFTIGTIIRGDAKPGKNAPILLQEPTEEQAAKAVEVARYLKWID